MCIFSKQLWAPDCATKNGKYYLYFPARDKQDIFRIGVAESSSPEGPFTPEAEPIPGSYSIDPACFVDDQDGKAYLYFGGIWGGQLQCWRTGEFVKEAYGEMEAKEGTNEGGPVEKKEPQVEKKEEKVSEKSAPKIEVDGESEPPPSQDDVD